MKFSRVLEDGKKGILRACADDVAFSLSRLKHVKLLFPIYQEAELLAGLGLHPKNLL